MKRPSWLLLAMLGLFRNDVEGFPKCPTGESCVQIKSCSPESSPPFTRCAMHPARVCCQQPPLNSSNSGDEMSVRVPQKCGLAFGKQKLEGLIIGGVNATRGKWPWMVSIFCQEKKKIAPQPICTGFLIDQRHVLTAAHCFKYFNTKYYSVRIGDVMLYKGKSVGVSRILLHPDYRRKEFHDDVAMLTLALDQRLRMPICLHESPAFAPKKATVVGWGSTRSSGPMSERLQELGGLPLVSARECERSLRNHLHNFADILPQGLYASLLCAGALKRDTCTGDSGGPLMVQEGGRWFAVGVVAFGTNNCAAGVPGVYTSVAHYLKWIEKNKED